jgi:hypothetical protein
LGPPDLEAGPQNFWSAGTMNCTIHTTAAQQRRVSRIYDRIDILFRDISDGNAHAAAKESSIKRL